MQHNNVVKFKRGSKGPKHDSYLYQEITVKSRNGWVTFHEGIGT